MRDKCKSDSDCEEGSKCTKVGSRFNRYNDCVKSDWLQIQWIILFILIAYSVYIYYKNKQTSAI
uniref:Uncharacterized protein n=1 Tax=Megaviridae environmental sample TaxID=1737588 RepID=A0A5J6VI32_9VIRU|nr:MAG: hypothetical protein [Megaviridae environmental sample]